MDNLLLLSHHLMKHSYSMLIWLVDILQLLGDHDEQFLKQLSKRADHLLQRKSLSYTLYLINRLFGYKPPGGSGFEDLSKGLSRLERGILGARISGRSIDRMGPLLAFLCIHGFRDRIAFLLETLFPKRSVVKQEFAIPFGGRRVYCYPGRLLQTLGLASRQLSLILGALIRGV